MIIPGLFFFHLTTFEAARSAVLHEYGGGRQRARVDRSPEVDQFEQRTTDRADGTDDVTVT